MSVWTGKKIVVIGGSRGVGRQIVESAAAEGARVLAVARDVGRLQQLTREVAGVQVLALDASAEDAPARVFAVLEPDVLVLCAGVFPTVGPLHQLTWQEFAVNWEADVKMAFHFSKAALSRPLPQGASVVMIASGAALAGSPVSGGYAGAKRTQIFIANYAQKESDRLRLGLRFTALAPRMMPDTELGKHAVAAYAQYLGIPEAAFIQSLDTPPVAADVATAVIQVVTKPDQHQGKVFIVSGRGLEAVS